MKKTFNVIQNYLLIASPFVVATMIWSSFLSFGRPENPTPALSMLWELLSGNLMLWFVLLIVYLAFIVFYAPSRESVLKKIANIKERDEREAYITGKASRATFISTLSVLILLLFASTFQVTISKLPAQEVYEGNTKMLSLGFDMSLWDTETTQKKDSNEVIFETKKLPLSKSSLILLLIVWQVAAYNWNVRKELAIS